LTPGETGIAIPFLFPLYRWIIRKTDGPAACPEIGAEDNGAQLALCWNLLRFPARVNGRARFR